MSTLPAKPLILYVDDDDLVAHLLQKEITGFEIQRVSNGDDAVDLLNRSGVYHDARRPDLVLLDLHMPKRDGFQTLAEIRATPTIANLPVAMFTTSQWPADRAKAFAHGANYFIQKPTALDGFAELAITLAEIMQSIGEPPGVDGSPATGQKARCQNGS